MDKKNAPKSDERREALRKMGLMAAYTAPAMTVMLASKKGNAGTLSGFQDEDI